MVWSWLPIVLATWIPVPAPLGVPVPPDSASASKELPRIPVGHGITSLWVEGPASVSAGPEEPGQPSVELPMLCGDVTPPGRVLTLGAGARVVLVGGDLQLMSLRGPAVHRWTGDELVTVAGARPALSVVAGYREGPLVPLPPTATAAADERDRDSVALAFVAPPATALRDTRPVLRWRWSAPNGRFDVTLARAADDGGDPIIERWRALSGRSLVLWAPLERGARYRATIAVHGARALAGGESDEIAFGVLADADEAALTRSLNALREAAGRAPDVHPELQVLRARLFETYGLLADAERTWAGLALLYPEHPELNAQARRLAGAVRDQ
ncbi:MAG: hypothetical protein CVU56_24120 [Deltaproteobacteria bacterium HGW-Deltaproteobacteria-14]|jgi:hypothetical protein|nr:MAG: hypothetical protein CVU56_24120 [Deltaproteobacteria bacterium HGW-Deltaproteobacteria-14]